MDIMDEVIVQFDIAHPIPFLVELIDIATGWNGQQVIVEDTKTWHDKIIGKSIPAYFVPIFCYFIEWADDIFAIFHNVQIGFVFKEDRLVIVVVVTRFHTDSSCR